MKEKSKLEPLSTPLRLEELMNFTINTMNEIAFDNMPIKKGILLERMIETLVRQVELYTYHLAALKQLPIDVKSEKQKRNSE